MKSVTDVLHRHSLDGTAGPSQLLSSRFWTKKLR